MGLFKDLSGARFSPCGQYRYTLWRTWDPERPVATFCMLNPSTANELDNDPTVERCQRRVHGLGYGGLRVGNIFAFRSTDPGALYAVVDPVGTDNDAGIMEMVQGSGLVICGWGCHGNHRGRGLQVLRMLLNAGVEPHCLVQNSDGQPGHPLYIGYGVKPRPVDLALIDLSRRRMEKNRGNTASCE